MKSRIQLLLFLQLHYGLAFNLNRSKMIIWCADSWFHCHFHQMANHHDLLFLLWDPLLDCIPAKSLESRIFFDLYPSLRSISKPLQKMKFRRFSVAIALLALASSLLLPTVRGFLLLTATLGHLLVVGVAGSWYYNLFLRFLLSHPSTKMLVLLEISNYILPIFIMLKNMLFSSCHLSFPCVPV